MAAGHFRFRLGEKEGMGQVRLVSRILICEGVISSSKEPPGFEEGGGWTGMDGDGGDGGMEGWRGRGGRAGAGCEDERPRGSRDESREWRMATGDWVNRSRVRVRVKSQESETKDEDEDEDERRETRASDERRETRNEKRKKRDDEELDHEPGVLLWTRQTSHAFYFDLICQKLDQIAHPRQMTGSATGTPLVHG